MMLTPRPMRGAITIKYTEINNFDKVGALNEERGRRQVTIEILKSIARHGQVFTLEQLHRQTGTPKSVLSVMLSRWEDRGFVERIERGKYLIIPLASEKGKYTLHEFVIASHLVRPSAIAYWSALHYHGLTEQIPMTVFVQTTARKKNNQLEVFGVDYRIVRVKPEKFFGFAKEWIEETQVTVTDREKTLVDCLDRPEYAGGIVEVAKALENASLDRETLSRYARMIGNNAVVRRLGYLSERMGIPLDLPLPTSRNYLLLDPTMPRQGENDPRWRLVINTEITRQGDSE
jgi:predicted transcriptional regulator of viral defense system